MKYFTIKELTYSATAEAKKLDNTPSSSVIKKLEELVANVLDPLREKYGKPIRISSGYRSTAVNRSVNGETSSQHLKGEAADITAGSKQENKKLFDIIKMNLPFDQLIDEKDFTWIHVSFKKTGNRKQILKL